MKHVLWPMTDLFGVGKVLKILEVWSLIVLLISSNIRKLAWKDDIKMGFGVAVVLNRFRMSMKALYS